MTRPRVLAVVGAIAVIVGISLYYALAPRPRPTTVAIATLMTHPSLDAVRDGVKAKLTASGYSEQTVHYVERNANGQVQLASTIASELASLSPDVIVAITTPMAQAVAKHATVPVCFAAVTDPVGAGLVSSWEETRPLITGTSDAWPYDAQLSLIREILPEAKTLGVLYNPGEAASQYGIVQIRTCAPRYSLDLVEAAVSTTADVYPIAQSLSARCDALLLSSDNTVIGGAAGAVKVAIDAKKPLFVGDAGTVAKGGLATVSVGYRALGEQTGELVVRLLKSERNIPIVVATGAEIVLNVEAAARMGVTFPARVRNRATTIYETIQP